MEGGIGEFLQSYYVVFDVGIGYEGVFNLYSQYI